MNCAFFKVCILPSIWWSNQTLTCSLQEENNFAIISTGGLSWRKERMLRNVKSRHCYHSLWVLTLPSPIVASALPPLTLKKAFHKCSDISYGRCSTGEGQKRKYLHLLFTIFLQKMYRQPSGFHVGFKSSAFW